MTHDAMASVVTYFFLQPRVLMTTYFFERAFLRWSKVGCIVHCGLVIEQFGYITAPFFFIDIPEPIASKCAHTHTHTHTHTRARGSQSVIERLLGCKMHMLIDI